MKETFEEIIKTSIDIDKPEFEKASKIHDWRNYVPTELQIHWPKLTIRERQIIILMAQWPADNENWD